MVDIGFRKIREDRHTDRTQPDNGQINSAPVMGIFRQDGDPIPKSNTTAAQIGGKDKDVY